MDLIIQQIMDDLPQIVRRANLRAHELDLLANIKSESRRKEWLTSKVIAWERYAKHIDYLASGAPVIEGGGHISISHSHQYVALLFSDTRCGIDIEDSGRNAAKIARKFTTEHEISIAREVYTDNAELLIWCAKEALYKYAARSEGDFIDDFKILSATTDTLVTTAYGNQVIVHFTTMESLLITYCT